MCVSLSADLFFPEAFSPLNNMIEFNFNHCNSYNSLLSIQYSLKQRKKYIICAISLLQRELLNENKLSKFTGLYRKKR